MRKVLITGANSGFGYLTTLLFARKGDYVYATTRNVDSAGVKKINEIVKREGLKIEWLILDITNDEQIKKVSKYVIDNGLDILVNNAGYGEIGTIELIDMERVKKQFETNFFGTLNLTKSLIPYFREKREGKIITVSSIAGRVSSPLYGVYSASKFAVEGLFESLRSELYRFNVKVSMIEPGAFHTSFGEGLEDKLKRDILNSPYREWYLKQDKNRELWSTSSDKQILKLLRNPQKVADKIYRVSLKRNPALRYVVGYDAIIISLIKKILPDWLFVFLVNNLIG